MNGIPNDPRPLVLGAVSTNCWILPLDGEGGPLGRPAAVIDPGDRADLIIAQLRRMGCHPAYILLTHGHFDHVAALPDLAAAYAGEGAPAVAIHEADAASLGPDSYPVHAASFRAASGDTALVDRLWKPMPLPSVLLREGDRIGPFLTLHLPGHSPGSAAFLWEGRNALFSGDTLFASGYGRTDLPGGDEGLLVESLRRLLSLDGRTGVHPGHGESTTVGGERRFYRGLGGPGDLPPDG